MVLLFGANGAQSLKRAHGPICRRFEQCWIDQYARRAAGTMDLLRDPDDDRIVLWLGQPIMGPGTGVRYVDLLSPDPEAYSMRFSEFGGAPGPRYPQRP